MNKLSSKPQDRENITVLTVSADADDSISFAELLKPNRCEIQVAKTCREALRKISECAPAVVACERELPDGSWRDLVSLIHKLKDQPPVIVMSRNADERLWAEVLNLGGYDVLAKPLEKREVSRVVAMACRFGWALQTA